MSEIVVNLNDIISLQVCTLVLLWVWFVIWIIRK